MTDGDDQLQDELVQQLQHLQQQQHLSQPEQEEDEEHDEQQEENEAMGELPPVALTAAGSVGESSRSTAAISKRRRMTVAYKMPSGETSGKTSHKTNGPGVTKGVNRREPNRNKQSGAVASTAANGDVAKPAKGSSTKEDAAPLALYNSRPVSAVSTEFKRPVTPESELIVALERLNKPERRSRAAAAAAKPVVGVSKTRLVKSANPKLFPNDGKSALKAFLPPVSKASRDSQVDAEAVSPEEMTPIPQDKASAIRAATKKWRAFVSSKKIGVEKTEKKSAAELNLRHGLKSAPIPRQMCSDVIAPEVNGMRVFGISKGGITRAIVKFSEPPASCPLTVCFHFPSTFLTHRYVLDMIRGKLSSVPGTRVCWIQFIDRNTQHGTQGMDNRWLVTLNNNEACETLLEKGLHLFNRHIVLRKYDDILLAEYKEYLEYLELQKKMYKMQEMTQADDASANSAELTKTDAVSNLLHLDNAEG